MIITGIVVLTIGGYAREAAEDAEREPATGARRSRARAYVVLAIALVVVAIPMVLNSLSSLWSRQVATAADSWLADGGARAAEVTGVSWSGSTVTVSVLAPQDLPDVGELQRTVDGLVPWDPRVVVVHTVGNRESAD